MASQPITRAQVFNAADNISAAGQQPTVASIRATLGTGSFTTITAMLREWKEQAQAPDDDTLDVPEEIKESLTRAAQIVWKSAQDHFRHELATVKAEAVRTIAAAQAQATDALTEIADLEKLNQAQAYQILEHKQLIGSLREEVRELGLNLAAARAEIRTSDNRLAEQADLLRRLASNPTKAPAPEKPGKPGKSPANINPGRNQRAPTPKPDQASGPEPTPT